MALTFAKTALVPRPIRVPIRALAVHGSVDDLTFEAVRPKEPRQCHTFRLALCPSRDRISDRLLRLPRRRHFSLCAYARVRPWRPLLPACHVFHHAQDVEEALNRPRPYSRRIPTPLSRSAETAHCTALSALRLQAVAEIHTQVLEEVCFLLLTSCCVCGWSQRCTGAPRVCS